jgi:flagellar basal-body rod protein FlgG
VPDVNVSLYQAASALNASNRWQEVISENIAASTIPGYKRQELSFSAVQAGFMSPSSTGAAQRISLPRAATITNFQQGELEATQVKTDVAIDGRGFFAVQLPNGGTGYTRDGEFQIDNQGQLATKQGFSILGQTGPIHLNMANSAPLSISDTGEVSQGAETRGKLKVVDFQQPQLLTPTGGGYFIAQNAGLVPTEIAQPSVRQGFLEASNTSAVMEMANLLTMTRGFEVGEKVIQLQDDRMGKAISELGSPN